MANVETNTRNLLRHWLQTYTFKTSLGICIAGKPTKTEREKESGGEEGKRERQTERQRGRDRERSRKRGRETERQTDRPNDDDLQSADMSILQQHTHSAYKPTDRDCDGHRERRERGNLPSPPVVDVGAFVKDEAVLVTLTVGYDDVLEVLHDVLCRPRHQAQTPLIIGLHVVVTVGEPETYQLPSDHPYPAQLRGFTE